MSLPDVIIDASLISILMHAKSPVSKSADEPMRQMERKKSAAVTKTVSSGLKSKLSSLTPVEKLTEVESKIPPPKAVSPEEASLRKEESSSSKRAALGELLKEECTKCPLAKTRNKYVFGSGKAGAPIMVIGEAPGREEDEQGLPFVGSAGKLLTDMLAAINIDRTKDVFITNVLKCRPPDNRTPDTAEITACLPILKRQIDIVKPEAILLLGRIAASALLDIHDSVAKIRGRELDLNGIPAIVTYHPAALLRNAEYKRPAWEDLKRFRDLLIRKGVYERLGKK